MRNENGMFLDVNIACWHFYSIEPIVLSVTMISV